MRVCLDVSQTVYEGTGSGRYVVELVKGLLELSDPVEYVLFGSARSRKDVLTSLSKIYNEKNNGHELLERYYSMPPAFFEFLWNKLHKISIEKLVGSFDIYHSSDWTQAPSKFKKVTTVHDLIPFLFSDYVHPRIKEAHISRWDHIIRDNVEVIVDAKSTKNDILQRFSIKEDKVHIIPLACNREYLRVGEEKLGEQGARFCEICESVMNKYTVKDKKYILTVGTLEPRKNINMLLEAYRNLPQELREEFTLVVVGKKAWAEEFTHIDNVIFTGYVEESDLPYLYSGAKCFIMPSLYEGFGIPVLEAMACATPVICSDSSSLPEIGGDDVHYIAEPEHAESIRIVLQHVLESAEAELAVVVRSAHERAKQFSWERTARETLDVYKKLA